MKRVPWEIWGVLVLIVLDGIAVIATYSRFPPTELYHVHHSDTVAGGFGRELVALNFPFALVGIALVGLAWPRLHGRLRIAGAVAIALCAVVYFAVDQADLDAPDPDAAKSGTLDPDDADPDPADPENQAADDQAANREYLRVRGI